MIYLFPIENYSNRYSEQWNRWFPNRLAERRIPYCLVPGVKGQFELRTDNVLDPLNTCRHKIAQLMHFLELVKDGRVTSKDVLLFHDVWFPGLETLQYVRHESDLKFKICGVLHAGSYDPHDYTVRQGMRCWATPLEHTLFNILDEVYVATEFHRELLLTSNSGLASGKIHVTGIPFYPDELKQYMSTPKIRARVAFPHRLVPEKNFQIVELLQEAVPELEFVFTRLRSNSRDEYLKLLSSCSMCLSDSLQETFGYSMLEAAAVGSIPIVPSRLSYPELFPEDFQYSTYGELIGKLRNFMSQDSSDVMANRFTEIPSLRAFEGSIDRILDLALS